MSQPQEHSPIFDECPHCGSKKSAPAAAPLGAVEAKAELERAAGALREIQGDHESIYNAIALMHVRKAIAALPSVPVAPNWLEDAALVIKVTKSGAVVTSGAPTERNWKIAKREVDSNLAVPVADKPEAVPNGASLREVLEAISTVCERTRNNVPTAFAYAPKVFQSGVSAVEAFVDKLIRGLAFVPVDPAPQDPQDCLAEKADEFADELEKVLRANLDPVYASVHKNYLRHAISHIRALTAPKPAAQGPTLQVEETYYLPTLETGKPNPCLYCGQGREKHAANLRCPVSAPAAEGTAIPHKMGPDTLAIKLASWANNLYGRYGAPVYLVGSSLKGGGNDVDIRIIIPYDEYYARWPKGHEDPAWAREMGKQGRQGAKWARANIDLQVQNDVEAIEHKDKPRLRLDTVVDSEPAPSPGGSDIRDA